MAFEEKYVWRSLEDCSSQEPSIKYLYVPGIFLKPLCVSISLESLSIFEVFSFLSKARCGAGQRRERSCDHRVSSRINYSVSIQPGSELWSPGASARLLGRSPGDTRAKWGGGRSFQPEPNVGSPAVFSQECGM